MFNHFSPYETKHELEEPTYSTIFYYFLISGNLLSTEVVI